MHPFLWINWRTKTLSILGFTISSVFAEFCGSQWSKMLETCFFLGKTLFSYSICLCLDESLSIFLCISHSYIYLGLLCVIGKSSIYLLVMCILHNYNLELLPFSTGLDSAIYRLSIYSISILNCVNCILLGYCLQEHVEYALLCKIYCHASIIRYSS